MASIVKRKKKFSVVYTYTDENGVKRQRWETFNTNAEAKKRKTQVEFQQNTGTFIPPVAKTLSELLEEYMSIYGVSTWAMSTYEGRKSLINHYINPIIGDMKLEDITPRIMDKYYRDLLSVKAVSSKYKRAKNEFLTPHTVREIHKLLRNAFNQAVKWEQHFQKKKRRSGTSGRRSIDIYDLDINLWKAWKNSDRIILVSKAEEKDYGYFDWICCCCIESGGIGSCRERNRTGIG